MTQADGFPAPALCDTALKAPGSHAKAPDVMVAPHAVDLAQFDSVCFETPRKIQKEQTRKTFFISMMLKNSTIQKTVKFVRIS